MEEIKPNAGLSGTQFLSNVNLANAVMQGADLTGASLINTDLTNANLCRANFTDAIGRAPVVEALSQWREKNRSLAVGYIREYLAENPAWEEHDGSFTHWDNQVTIEVPPSEGVDVSRLVFKIRDTEGHSGILSYIRKCMWPHRCATPQNIERKTEVWRWAENDRDRLAREDTREFRDSIVEKAYLTGYPSIWLAVFQHDAQMIQDINEYREANAHLQR